METVLNSQALPQRLGHVYSLLQPKSTTDIAALTLFATISAGYVLKGKLWDRKDPFDHIWYERPQQQFAASDSESKSTRNIAQKLEEANKDCVVFWGSQSGTAEGFAARLAKECQLRFSLNTMTADLSDYDAETIALIPRTKLVIFILSTYGEGDPSDNTTGFWDWINKTPGISLATRYAAFGLGNSNYKHYNRVVRVVSQKLNDFGAKMLLPVGKADDAERSTEEDFVSWKDDLFRMFREDLDLQEHAIEYQPAISVIEDESLQPIDLHLGEPSHSRDNPRAATHSSPIKALAIKQSRELFTAGDRHCIYMELDLSSHSEVVYKTGDHLAIWPSNPEEEVTLLLDALNLTSRREIPLLLKATDSSRLKLPSPTTLIALFRSYLEICAPVSRETILALATFAPTLSARTYLTKLAESRESYAEFTSHTHLTLRRLLSLSAPNQPWTSLPLAFILESLPTLQPRYYSISSSSVLSPRRIAITALVSSDELASLPPSSTPDTKPARINGVTTNYLLAHQTHSSSSPITIKYTLPTTPSIYASIRKSKFKLPISKSTPIIMIAAGTGIAPFRAFILERAKLAATGQSVGEMLLFFGCRSPDEDYIYKDEIANVVNEGKVRLRVIEAYSRKEGEERMYVQDRVEEYAKEVVGMLAEGASFFICGRTGMAKEVGRVMSRVTGDGGNDWVEGLKRCGKWREDVWG